MDTMDRQTGEVLPATAMPPAIAAAIVEVMGMVRQIGKDADNKHGGYKYVSIDKMFDSVGPIMAEAGLGLLIDEVGTEVKASERSGAPWLFATYELTLFHGSGVMAAPLRRALAMPINGPQTYGAAQSYVQKQFLRALFQVPTGDKDADDTPQDGAPPAGRALPRQASQQQPGPAKPAAVAGQAVGEDPRKAEARAKFDAIRGRIAAAPHLTALDHVMRDAAADLTFIKEVSAEGYERLMNASVKRRSMLAQQESDPGPNYDEPAP